MAVHRLLRGLLVLLSGLLVCLGALPSSGGIHRPQPSRFATHGPTGMKPAKSSRFQAPFWFEPNVGQAPPEVQYLSRGRGYNLSLGAAGACLSLHPETNRNAQVTMVLRGAAARPELTALDRLPGQVNYLIGNDSRRWRTHVPMYARVQATEVYPGIDLVYYGNQGRLEYDFIVRPGGHPEQICQSFLGATGVDVDRAGDLLIHTDAGNLRQHRPRVYQEAEGKRREIPATYVVSRDTGVVLLAAREKEAGEKPGPSRDKRNPRLAAAFQVGLRLGGYDRTRPLVVDPVLEFATLAGNVPAMGMAVDDQGNTYLVGLNTGVFRTSPGAFDTTRNGKNDTCILKLNPQGTGAVYATYLGGQDEEDSRGVAANAAGEAFIYGWTESADFPTTPGAFQRTLVGLGADVYVAKLSADGASLVYSTLIGGSFNDIGSYAHGIAIDETGCAYVTGDALSRDFPATPGAYQFSNYGRVFVVKLNPTGSALVYSASLGSGTGRDIAVDAAGCAYVVGDAIAAEFPTTPGAFQPTSPGREASFVTKLNASGSGLVYSTFLGGGEPDEQAWTVAVDAAGAAYVAGETHGVGFPVTDGAFQISKGNPDPHDYDVYVTKLRPDGAALEYSTLLGGSSPERWPSLDIDSNGRVYLTGETHSNDFPLTTDATGVATRLNGMFVSELSASGRELVYSTCYPTNIGVVGYDLTVKPAGLVYVAGIAFAGVLETTPGAYETTQTTTDGFAASFRMELPAPSDLVAQALSSSRVQLAWVDNSHAEAGYVIERKTGASGYAPIATLGASVTTYTDQGLTPDTAYTYRVRATAGAGQWSAYSRPTTATTTSVPPAPPGSLTAVAQGAHAIRLTWTDRSGNESAFDIQRRSGAGGFLDIASVGANVTTFLDMGLAASTTYTYQVRARNSSGASSFSNEATATTGPRPPEPPSQVRAVAPEVGRVVVTWSDNSNNEEGFTVERSLGDGNFTTLGAVGTNITRYEDGTVANNITYVYRVRAQNAGGDSAYSTSDPVTTLSRAPTAPSNLRITASTADQVSLAWTDNSSTEDSFVIERAIENNAFIATGIVGLGVTTFVDRNLLPDTTFMYRVRAALGVTLSAPSNTVSITTPPPPATAPAAPSNLTARAAGPGQVDLAWTDRSTNETGFLVERSTTGTGFGQAGTVDADQAAFHDGGLEPATTYFYRVRAVNSAGNSAPSNTAQVTTLPAPPAVPNGLRVKSATATGITLAWNAVAGATTFEVERKNVGGAFSSAGSTGSVEYMDAGLQPNTTYSYRIRARNDGGSSSYSDVVDGATLPLAPEAPRDFAAAAQSSATIRLTWTAPTGPVTGYRLERSADSGATWTPIGPPAVTDTTYLDGNLEPDTAYQYRLQANNAGGSSPYAGPVTARTLAGAPLPPTRLSVIGMTATSVTLAWEASPGASSYLVERQSGGGAFASLGVVTGTSYTDTTAHAGVAYGYRVKAQNGGGESDYISIVSATIPAGGKLKRLPRSINFGTVARGGTRRKTLRLTNQGKGPLVVTVSAPSAPFALASGGGMTTLAPKKSVVVTLLFTPTSTQAANVSLRISSTDPAASTNGVALLGKGR